MTQVESIIKQLQQVLFVERIVKKLKRRNIWGQCSIYKQIFLPRKLVVFPLELVDEVMLHEMTHLKYMHHRKQFWDYFSLLLGKDAKLYKIKENEFSPNTMT